MAALACKKGFTFKSKYDKHLKTREHFFNIDSSSDENDPDEEIMRLMSTIDSKGNYKPFKSNVAAMAHLLAHSPRPMFRVPGFVSPTTHSTSNNIPFYVNALDNTLKMCLANPDIANNLVRYPIISSEYREIYHG
ncbi:hypothetical protein EMCRGX_G019538 [Ephydatia muelleri]